MRPDIKTFDPAKHSNLAFKYAHIKRDGHMLKVQMGVNDQLYCWTSNPTDIVSKLEFCKWFPLAQKLPRGVSLLGELWLPGSRSEAIKTAIKDGNERLQFDVFAIDSWRFDDDRHNRLQNMSLQGVADLVGSLGFPFIPWFDWPFTLMQLQGVLKANPSYEGFVLKDGNLSNWYKLKPRKTIDLVVTSFQPGAGKYLNQIGSLVCSTSEGYEVANVSGMTDIQRTFMSNNTDLLLGKVVECEYQNVGANGRLRHPAFVRTREDKEPNQCSVKQDDDLSLFWSGPDELPLFK